MSRSVFCVKLHQQAEGLDFAPWPGELGKRIFENVSKKAWGEWLAHQTMLINEHRLNPLEAKTRSFLSTEMEKYFFGEGCTPPAGYVSPEKT